MAQYAIIEESGGQRKVEQGQAILIDLVEGGIAKPGSTVTVDKVLVVGEPGGEAKLGTPYVAGASVTLEITDPEVMGQKLYIYKFKAKKGFDKKTGHRQRFTGAVVKAIKA